MVIRTGPPDTTPDAPAHTPGIRMGNEPGSFLREPGHLPDGRCTARRSTGVNHRREDPIDPGSPNLPPG
jgi:hypothetical protein